MPVTDDDVALAYAQWRSTVEIRERDRAKLLASTANEAEAARTFARVLDEYVEGLTPVRRKIHDR